MNTLTILETKNKMDKKRLLELAGIQLDEMQGDSRKSDGMTGQEFDFEMEPDYITILKNNKDTGVTIPIDNWDKMITAYNKIINAKHNY